MAVIHYRRQIRRRPVRDRRLQLGLGLQRRR
jgi:hypothetical protein